MDSSPRRARSTSRHSTDRRPLGPRSPSPLPLLKPPVDINAPSGDDEDIEMADEVEDLLEPRGGSPSPLPRSKRQPFEPMNNTDATPKSSGSPSVEDTPVVEPLSIKKKSSVRSSELPPRRSYQIQRSSPLLKPTNRLVSEKRTGVQSKQSRIPVPSSHTPSTPINSGKEVEEADRLLTTYESTKNDVGSRPPISRANAYCFTTA